MSGCGSYPAASSFAAQPYRPLTPDENARWLAAVAAYNDCLGPAQGSPPCPKGSWFSGSFSAGRWNGQCISTFTGQPTTDPITAAGQYFPNADAPAGYSVAPVTAAAPAAAPSMPATAPSPVLLHSYAPSSVPAPTFTVLPIAAPAAPAQATPGVSIPPIAIAGLAMLVAWLVTK